MAESSVVAPSAQEVVPGVWEWHVANELIGGHTSTGHAVETPEGTVLIDPVRLDDAALERLGPVHAILLTAQCHQRSAWRYRRELGARVWAPHTRPMEEEPDERYEAGDLLPGGLRVLHTPGPEDAHYSFLREEPPRVLFCSDLLMRAGDGLAFTPLEYHDEPATTRRTVESLLDVDFDVLCLDHGEAITADPHAAIRAFLTT